MRYGSAEPLPDKFHSKYVRLQIADWHPGWTLEYIDSLSYAQVGAIFAYQNAQRLNEKLNRG